jgi:hypothetical protein
MIMRKLIPVLVSVLLSLGAMAGENDKNKAQPLPTVGKQNAGKKAPAQAPAKGHGAHVSAPAADAPKANDKNDNRNMPKVKKPS